MSQEIKNRLKSFAWRGGSVAVVALLNFAAENLGAFNLPPIVVTLLGLGIAECTKWLNNNTTLFGKALKN